MRAWSTAGLLVVLSPSIFAAPLELPPGALEAAKVIDTPTLMGPLEYLASDLLEGRGAASRGDELARAYIASVLRMLGLTPAGPAGGWQQPFDIVGVTAKVPPVWSFQTNSGAGELKHWDEFIAGSGVQQASAKIEGSELAFVGYGIVAPEHRWDDFKGADLKGKVLLMLNNDPDWDPALFAGKTRLYYGRWSYKYESAARQGAAGAIIIHTTPSAGYPWQVVQSSWSGEQFELPWAGEPQLQVKAWATEAAVRRLLASAGHDLDRLVASAQTREFRPVDLSITTSLEFNNEIRQLRTGNVMGLLEGADPALKDQVVVYTAHHDHLGVGKPNSAGDRIYNGALDNASGVAQMLAIAKAFTALPQRPRRSILFLAVGVEESGLLGSEYYAAHPTVAPGKMAANINYDGANIWGRTRDVALIGGGKSTIDQVAIAAAALQGRTVIPELFPDRGFYYRSDQFNFARIGVPALYLDTGSDFIDRPAGWGKEQLEAWEARHYHQPSDQLDADWSFEGMIEDAQLGFYVGLHVANAETTPTWVPGDEFEAARKQALAALQ
jgi:Zn-dependent M28 family amino/carboxypeptidase